MNSPFMSYCDMHGIEHNFSAYRTPQQNGVVERKNRTLQEIARTMLKEHDLPTYFWCEAINTACYVQNRVLMRPLKISYFRVFGCKYYILNMKDHLHKFDCKADEGVFLGYSTRSKAYRVYNKRTKIVEESMHVTFDETNPFKPRKVVIDDIDEEMQRMSLQNQPYTSQQGGQGSTQNGQPSTSQEPQGNDQNNVEEEDMPRSWRMVRYHPQDQIICDVTKGVSTRRTLNAFCEHHAFISHIEPKNVKEALGDDDWIIVMQEELNQFERNKV